MIYTVIPHTGIIYSKFWLGELFEHCKTPDPEERDREININLNRHETQQLFIKTHDCHQSDDILLLDSDVLTDKDALDTFYAHYVYNARKPLAVDTKEFIFEGHVCCACCLVPYDTYRAINYLDKPDECQCLKIPGVSYFDGAHFDEFKEELESGEHENYVKDVFGFFGVLN